MKCLTVDDPDPPLVAAAAPSNRDAAARVAPTAPLPRREQLLGRLGGGQLGKIRDRHPPATRSHGLVPADTHGNPLQPGVHVEVVAFSDLDQCLLPVRALAEVATEALLLAPNHHRADLLDAHVEQRLDGLLDLDLGGVLADLEGVGVRRFGLHRRLLGQERADDDLGDATHASPPSRAWSLATVPVVRTRCS